MAQPKFDFKITLSAASQAEATRKVKAATTLCQKLSADEIAKLAEVVASDPAKVRMAKQWLGL